MKKELHKAPKRLQRMLLRIQVYDARIIYRKGKQMELADTLSRAHGSFEGTTAFEREVETVNMTEYLSVSAARLDDIKAHTETDNELQMVIEVVKSGWPEERKKLPVQITPYWAMRDEFTTQDGLLFRGQRVVVPKVLRREMIERLHSAHMGIESCLRRARECLYWPGMSSEVKEYVQRCETCRTYDSKQPREPLHSHDPPERPWSKVGVDIFTFNGREYLLTVDYFSSYWEIDLLDGTKSKVVIRKLKAQFARFGIPDVKMTDNGRQFSSRT